MKKIFFESSDYETSIIRKISCLFRLSNSIMKQKLRKYNIGRGQFHFLMYLFDHGDGISQEELNEKLRFDKATTTRALKKLIKSGYVTKKVDETDHRVNRIFLTDKAYEIRKEVEIVNQELEKIITEHLSDQEKNQFDNLLDKMINNVVLYRNSTHEEAK